MLVEVFCEDEILKDFGLLRKAFLGLEDIEL